MPLNKQGLHSLKPSHAAHTREIDVMMSIMSDAPWLFLIVVGFAVYFQTVTGFGMGLIMMGLAGCLAFWADS